MSNLIDVQSITTQVRVHLTEDELKRLELALMVTVDEFLNDGYFSDAWRYALNKYLPPILR